MTCPVCGFENRAGSEVCGRCGAALVWKGPREAEAFAPPRAGRGKGLYPLFYWLRRAGFGFYGFGFIRDLRRRLAGTRGALLLSVIPGLGQIYRGQRGLGALLLAAWLVFLWLAWRFMVGLPGIFFVFLAVLVHMFAAVRAGRLADFNLLPAQRFRAVLPVALAAVFGYMLLFNLARDNWMRLYEVDVPVPAAGVERLDYLRFRRGAPPFAAGDIALRQAAIGGYVPPGRNRAGHIPVLVLSPPGAAVAVAERRLTVNGETLPPEWFADDFPWPAEPLNFTLPPGQHLVWPLVRGRYGDVIGDYWNAWSRAAAAELEARVVELYYPYGRRRPLGRLPAAGAGAADAAAAGEGN